MAGGVKKLPWNWKVLVVGNRGVGKTSIITRFAQKMFHDHDANPQEGPYIAPDFQVAVLNIDGIAYKMQVWDTYGGERQFVRVPSTNYRKIAAILLVYDVTKRETYNSLLKNWVKGFREHTANADRKVIPCIVGNKSDLHDQRQVFREEAEAFARSIGALFYEASAKTGDNVDHIFEEIARKVIEEEKIQASGAASQYASHHARYAIRDKETKWTSCRLL